MILPNYLFDRIKTIISIAETDDEYQTLVSEMSAHLPLGRCKFGPVLVATNHSDGLASLLLSIREASGSAAR